MYYSQKKNTYAGVSFYLKLQPFNLQRVILLKEDLRIMCFPMNFAKFLKTSFLKTSQNSLDQGVSLRNQKQPPQVFYKSRS